MHEETPSWMGWDHLCITLVQHLTHLSNLLPKQETLRCCNTLNNTVLYKVFYIFNVLIIATIITASDFVIEFMKPHDVNPFCMWQHDLSKPAFSPALSKRVGLDELQRSFPTSAIP